MRKTLIFFSFYISLAFCQIKAQTLMPDKINFIDGQTWAQIKEKALAENKYIFLDAFTTWCVPCMRMDKEIFTQKKVAHFFNENFINVKVQMDVTKHDKEETKRWYSDAKAISAQYNVDSYPTYLFFNSQGELVQRNSSTTSADEFIDVAASAKGNYFVQKLSFERGERNQDFLLGLLKAAQLINDSEFIPRVANAYLATQTNLLTDDNIKLIAIATKATADPGFSILLSHPADIDNVLRSGYSKKKTTTILFNEIALPYLRIDVTIKDYGGGMIVIGGKLRKSVDWINLREELDFKYPELAKNVVFMAKVHYYESLADWDNFTKTVNQSEVLLDNYSINQYARIIFQKCEDVSQINQALRWSDRLVEEDGKNPDYLATYGDLLYKSGQTPKAIKTYKILIQSKGNVYGRLSEVIAKMEKGEKTW